MNCLRLITFGVIIFLTSTPILAQDVILSNWGHLITKDFEERVVSSNPNISSLITQGSGVSLGYQRIGTDGWAIVMEGSLNLEAFRIAGMENAPNFGQYYFNHMSPKGDNRCDIDAGSYSVENIIIEHDHKILKKKAYTVSVQQPWKERFREIVYTFTAEEVKILIEEGFGTQTIKMKSPGKITMGSFPMNAVSSFIQNKKSAEAKKEILINQAKQAEASGDLTKAKQLYQQAFDLTGDSKLKPEIERVANTSVQTPTEKPVPQNGSKTETQGTTESSKATFTDGSSGKSDNISGNDVMTQIEAKRKQDEQTQQQMKEHLTSGVDAGGQMLKGISKGSINLGVRLGNPDKEFKDLLLPQTLGLTFGYFKGTEIMLREKGHRYGLPWGAYTFASWSYGQPKDVDVGGVREGFASTIEMGLNVGLGLFTIVELMPSVGVSFSSIEGTPIGEDFFREKKITPHVGVIGRWGFLYYGYDYNLFLETGSLTIGISMSKKR